MRASLEAGNPRMILDLIRNVSLLIALAVGLELLTQRLEGRSAAIGLAGGVLFGAVGIVGMMTPLQFAPGVIHDGRSIVLGLAGLFGGPAAAGVSALLCGGYRLYLGGAGTVAGLAVIAEAAAIGTVLHFLRQRDERWVSPLRLWASGLVIHLVMMTCQLLIPDIGWEVVSRVGPTILVFYPLAFFLLAQVFLSNEQRRHTEQALRDSEEQYRRVSEDMPVMICRFVADGELTYVNEAYARYFGRTTEELVGIRFQELIPAPSREAVMAVITALSVESSTATQEHRMVAADGDIRWARWTNRALFDDDGRPVAFQAIGEDVTREKLAEEVLRAREQRYRHLLDHIEAGVMVHGPDAGIRFCNRRAKEALGLDGDWPSSAAGPLATWTFVAEDGAPMLADQHPAERVVASGESLADVVVGVLRTTDEEPRWLLVNAFPERTEGGVLEQVIVTFIDITDRRRADEERRRLEAQVQEAQRLESLGVLAGGVAHDFNNMLAAITGCAELALEATPAKSAVGANMRQLLVAARRASELVNQILAFSRRAETERRVVSPSAVLDEAVKLIKATLPSSIRLRYKVVGEVPPVLADATQLSQVIMNLATNAHHAMWERGGELCLTLSAHVVDAAQAALNVQARPGEYAHLAVHDTGVGVPAENLTRIFEPFFTTKEVGKGTGMGLATSHGIVASHGGFMTVDSEVGVGSTFHVFLPAVTGAVPEVAVEARPATSARRSGRVLVVDDEPVLLDVATRLLGVLGFEVTAFATGAEALAAFTASPAGWALVLTDQTMPGLSGVDVLNAVKEARPDLPVVIMTGHSDKLTLAADGGVGADAVLRKPFNKRTLTDLLQVVLGPGSGAAG